MSLHVTVRGIPSLPRSCAWARNTTLEHCTPEVDFSTKSTSTTIMLGKTFCYPGPYDPDLFQVSLRDAIEIEKGIRKRSPVPEGSREAKCQHGSFLEVEKGASLQLPWPFQKAGHIFQKVYSI